MNNSTEIALSSISILQMKIDKSTELIWVVVSMGVGANKEKRKNPTGTSGNISFIVRNKLIDFHGCTRESG